MKKVLVVDDEIMVRMGMRSLINWEEHGCRVVADAADGADALAKIEQYAPDVVFTDLMMEPVDGFALIREARARWPHILFVILSNYNDYDNVRLAMKLGAVDYIFKLTVSEAELAKVLADLDALMPSPPAGGPPGMNDIVYKNIPAIKSRLIRSVIEKSYLDANDLLREMEILGVALDFAAPYAALHLSIDNFAQEVLTGKFTEGQLLLYSVENVVLEVLRSQLVAEGFIEGDGRLLFLVAAPGGILQGEEGLYAKIKGCFALITEYLQRYFGLSVTSVVSGVCTCLPDVAAFANRNKGYFAHQAKSEWGALHFAGAQQETRDDIQQAKEYIHLHMAEELPVERVATAVNLSPSHFSRLFKENVGMGFVDYVNETRMRRAVELMRNPALRLEEIALAVGIRNYNYFSSLFKKMMGDAPAKYRRQAEAQKPNSGTGAAE